jgi:hypothetical protein
LGWLEGKPPTPDIRAYNTDFFRTQGAFLAALGTTMFVLFIILLPIGLFHVYPAAFDVGAVIDLYVAIGTGLLGAAAIATLYFQAIDRTADRAPNLELTPRYMDSGGRQVPMEVGEFLTLDMTMIDTEVTNVGPGVARDVWYSIVPPSSEPEREPADGTDSAMLRQIPLRRFIRAGNGVALPSSLMGIRGGGSSADGESRLTVLVVGCVDLDGKLGDVEIAGFETRDSPTVIRLLSPVEAEAALWDLTDGYTHRWWRRMGFFVPPSGLKAGVHPPAR